MTPCSLISSSSTTSVHTRIDTLSTPSCCWPERSQALQSQTPTRDAYAHTALNDDWKIVHMELFFSAPEGSCCNSLVIAGDRLIQLRIRWGPLRSSAHPVDVEKDPSRLMPSHGPRLTGDIRASAISLSLLVLRGTGLQQ